MEWVMSFECFALYSTCSSEGAPWVPGGSVFLLHKPSLLPHNNHQLSQTADLLTKQTLLNIAMCKCTIIFLIAKNMSFLRSIASRRDC